MLVRMCAVNFCSFKCVELPLSGQGLVWIGGQNNDSEGATSNGAGKSTIFKALTWGLYGETIDGEKGDGVIRHGQAEAEVLIDIAPCWTLRRIRKKGVTKLLFHRKGVGAFEGDKKQIQTKINEIIGLDFKAFKNTILYGQNDSARFADSRVRDAERKDMLNRIMRTGILKDCHKLALSLARDKKTKVVESEQKISSMNVFAGTLKSNLKEEEKNSEIWEENRKGKIAKLCCMVDSIKSDVKAMMEGTEDVGSLREKKFKLRTAISRAERAKVMGEHYRSRRATNSSLAEKHFYESRAIQSSINLIQNELKNLEGERCPVCNGNLKSEDTKKHKDDLEEQIQTLEEEKEKAIKLGRELRDVAADDLKKAEKAEAKAVRISSYRARLESIQYKIHAAETTVERAKETLKGARMIADQIKEVKEEENPHHDRILRLQSYIIKLVDEIREENKFLKAHNDELELLEFWSRGFSGQGLPSYILDGVMQQITDRANHYLDTLADGDITMEFKTQRELKSSKGEYRDEIDIRWTVEGVSGYPPSGGQQRKMEIATDLALMDLAESLEGSKLDLFIADEILDGLDVEGTNRVLKLLQELRSRRETIFVISHQSSMSEIFEKSLYVEKNEGISTLGDPK